LPSGLLMYGLVALALLGALGGIYYKGYTSGADSVRLEWQEASQAQREAEQKQAQKAAEKKETGDQKARVVYRKITQEVERVVEKPVYRHVCLDDDGLRHARDAIRGAVSDPAKPDQSVRPTAGTK